jgi:hypothetical protein
VRLAFCGLQARTIDLCNNPKTKEPKIQAARRIVAEWPGLDQEQADFTAQVCSVRCQVCNEVGCMKMSGAVKEQAGLHSTDLWDVMCKMACVVTAAAAG